MQIQNTKAGRHQNRISPKSPTPQHTTLQGIRINSFYQANLAPASSWQCADDVVNRTSRLTHLWRHFRRGHKLRMLKTTNLRLKLRTGCSRASERVAVRRTPRRNRLSDPAENTTIRRWPSSHRCYPLEGAATADGRTFQRSRVDSLMGQNCIKVEIMN